jgi:hypothetical protein
MAAVNKLVCCGLVTIALAAVGCSPSATNKPEPATASSAAAKPATPGPGEGQRGATGESTTGQSSLDELQKGKQSTPVRSRMFTLASIVTIWKARHAKHSK